MLLALCVCVCVDASQKCATVNRLRGKEVTLPLPLARSINSDKQHNTAQISFLPFLLVCTGTYCMSLHISHRARKIK